MAHQGLGRGVHGLGVQRLPDVPDPAVVQRRRRPPVEDAVEVAPPLGREAGVEVFGRLGRLQDGDGLLRQVGVDGVADGGGRPGPLQVDVDHLRQGVDPGVGAARSVDRRRLAGKGGDRLLQRRLHRRQDGLGLEAAIGASVVLHDQTIAGHQSSRAQTRMG